MDWKKFITFAVRKQKHNTMSLSKYEKEILPLFKKANNHYKYLQEENCNLEYWHSPEYICIHWSLFMDKHINMHRVWQIAHFLRKHTDLPIYCSFGKLNI